MKSPASPGFHFQKVFEIKKNLQSLYVIVQTLRPFQDRLATYQTHPLSD